MLMVMVGKMEIFKFPVMTRILLFKKFLSSITVHTSITYMEFTVCLRYRKLKIDIAKGVVAIQ